MVDMLNAVKSVLTDVSSVSPSSEQRGTTVCLAEGMEGRDSLNHTRKRKNFQHSRVAHVCWKTILSTAKYLLYTSYNLMPKLPYFRNGANIIHQLESA